MNINLILLPYSTAQPWRRMTAVSIVLLLLSASLAMASGGWFTGRTIKGQTRPVTAEAENRTAPNATISPGYEVFSATGLPAAIPDGDHLTSLLPVSRSGTSGAVTISYHITHSYIGNIRVTLIAPSGAEFLLRSSMGTDGQEIEEIDLAIPGAETEMAMGTWQLVVEDLAPDGATGMLDSWSLKFPAPDTAVIDLVMSLSANPQGDDNGNAQGQAGSEAQDKWERIVQHFADAVYESTNAAHKIRTVRIFREGRSSGRADILWTASGHPHVPSRGGVGESGGHINMYESFTDGSGPGMNKDMLADEIGSGYTMAHEWGHYFYNIYDEYKVNSTDVAVMPSIMTSQWRARGGDRQWLNFSIKNAGGGDFQNTLQTRQHDQHGASDWETLARMTSSDIKTAAQLTLGKRIFYPEVAAAAPAAGATPRVDLPGTARSFLNIIWMNQENVYQIIVDRSGSMSTDQKMEQAKAAAKFLVNLLPLGKSRVGVSQFNATVQQIQPIIPLMTEADRTAVKTVIDGITASGNTAIGAAADEGLSTILAVPNAEKSNRVVFLLSDGFNGFGVEPASVIPRYQTAQIPLFTFGFGADADAATLGQMANGTGGKYYSSTASLAAITTAFQDAQSVAAGSPSIAAGTSSVAAATAQAALFTIDSTVKHLNFSLTHGAGVDSMDLHLLAPNGLEVQPADSFTVGTETLLSYSIANPQTGDWRLSSPSGSTTDEITFTASGITEGITYAAAVGSEGGSAVSHPAPIVLRARLFRALQITGVPATAIAVGPDGALETIPLYDDGTGGDEISGDGNYAATYRYRQNGTYTFKVNFDSSAGGAMTTYNGGTFTATENEEAPPPIPNQLVSDSFTRSSQVQVTTDNGVFDGGGMANISTRLDVQTGDNVLIGGFIITGSQPKNILVRGIGSSLSIPGKLQDTLLQLYNSAGTLIATNDNWRDNANASAIIATTIPPIRDSESALLMSLAPGSYTVVLRGVNGTTGIGLVEAYDLSATSNSRLANISSRGFVQTGDGAMIGGLIIIGDNARPILVRGLGPSLPVAGALADPTLQLFDSNGVALAFNDDWRDTQAAEIIATTIPPMNEREAAIVSTLSPGAYTAVLRGANGGTGVALVELYDLQP